MSTKKVSLVIAVVDLAVFTGRYLTNVSDRETPPEQAAPNATGAESKVAAAVVETTEIESADTEPGTTMVPGNESIVGTVVDESGLPVEGARLFPLNTEGCAANWRKVPHELRSNGNTDLTRPLERLFEDYRRQAAKLPKTVSAEDGSYRFYNLDDGNYRVVAGHQDYLPHRDNWAIVREQTASRCDKELVGSQAISGRVVDDAGRDIAGASIHVRTAQERRLGAHDRLDQLVANWSEGRFLVDPGTAQSQTDGTFRIGSLEPTRID